MSQISRTSDLDSGNGRSRYGLRRFSGPVTALLLLLTAACATKGDVRSLQEEVRELNSQNQLLLEQLRDEVGDARRAQNDSLQLLSRSMREFRAETARRFTNVEDNLLLAVELAGISQQQLATLRDQYEQDRARSAFQTPGGPDAGPGGAGDDDARATYESAMTQLRRGSYSAARMGFMEVVENHANHELAPDARFHLADVLVQEGELEAAIEQFLEVREYHPNHPRVPDALYRVGLLHIEMGNDDEAEDYFQRVVNTWPDSDAAELAREALERLG